MSISTSSAHTRVALVGRPNVGKSTLFNVLTSTRKAVVKNQPGVTRDIQAEVAEWRGQTFEVLDTGGLTDGDVPFNKEIKKNVESLLMKVDLVIMIVDGRSGLLAEDRDVLDVIRRSEKPYLVVVNKVDSRTEIENSRYEFAEFGDEIVVSSFEQRRGVDEILEWIVNQMKPSVIPQDKGIVLAIMGKPNAGKSSLANRILGEERMLVSEMAGTTVDAIDLHVDYRGRHYTLIDTAGLRRQARRQDDVEIISAFKSLDALKRADIILLLIDAVLGPSEQDAKIVEKVIEQHKGIILVANKSDLAAREVDAYRETFREKVAREIHFFEDIPIVFISAKTGQGLDALFDKVDEIWNKLHCRITTRELNDFFMRVIRQAPAPVHGTQNVQFYYLTQTKQVPPSFIAFVNYPESVNNAYRRFLSKRIKEEWSLEGVPIRIFAMKSRKALRDRGSPEVSEIAEADLPDELVLDDSIGEELNEDYFEGELD